MVTGAPVPLVALALDLARTGLPVMPVREGKGPVGNCRICHGNVCGGRPNMVSAGPCRCPRPCHAWAAATTNPKVLTSPAWARAWRDAVAVAYHPGGAGVTVLDLDTAEAVIWARTTLPATVTVASTRGEHWIYRGAMRSSNGVRDGVDIKSLMQYARWLGNGTGTLADLPDAVRALADREDTNPAPDRVGVVSSTSGGGWSRTARPGCRHTERFVRTGLDQGLARIHSHREHGAGTAAHSAARFLAAQHRTCPGPCHLDDAAAELVAAAESVGVPHAYALRSVTRGLSAP